MKLTVPITDGRLRLCGYCSAVATHSWVAGRGVEFGCDEHATLAEGGWLARVVPPTAGPEAIADAIGTLSRKLDDGSVMIAYALLLVMPVIFLATLAASALAVVS